MAISAAAASVRCSAVPVAAPTGCRRFDGRSGKLASVRFCGGVSAAQSLRAMAALDSRSESLQSQKMQVMANAGKTDETEVEKKTENYTDTMQQAMGTGLTYRHELGMNYAHVLPDLIVGSCLQTPADVDRLKEAGVGTIFCLQQDPDLAYFSVDIEAIINHAKEVDGIEHIRAQIRDFDPYDLRQRLPQVIATLYQATKKNEGTAYVHCTAGLGRAPAVALTYMYWIRGYDLFEANAMLQKVRTCHPKLDSIKAATADLLTGNSKEKVKLAWYRGAAQSVEVAGLDVGWYERVAFTKNQEDGHWYLERDLPVGKYEFKYIVDGNWCTNPDASSTQPNNDGHVNNFIEVKGNKESWDLRQRIMAGDFVLTDEHRQIIKAKLEALAG
ncbi:hypothetical protein MPTK1_1g21210 [Marchantia polymorpha subsp. ruderalis]|uniref:Tyrosine specific protein phosphatases domain-containing protein n=2 Tax=Marchantia polymorpha TaxID=3197 RepID=A0AAF6ASK5_MARPO|nr:hypothetical protein MARPO_0001s0455 [Marchantia polymorpha]BBM99425.1 hypothetical protein Mp_1g21210 [Marchantia polymorpha subsp. ruderalis]|eukprot:PTQ50506.1 hypothetical protein MARPO_0001s0455 [Marchantia polymorpha]